MVRLMITFMRTRLRATAGTAVVLFWALSASLSFGQQSASSGTTLIGLEYAVVDSDRLANGMAETFAPLNLTSMKLLGEASQWGRMQKRQNSAIDFSGTDRFVKAYQAQGVNELVMALKSHSPWASVHVGWFGKQNPTPKPQFRKAYKEWVGAVVERYDNDGMDDMPGLLAPVRYYEIGSEFSSYEPEPVDDYIDMLTIAYAAAKSAYPGSIVTHAAFLTTPLDLNVSTYTDLNERWHATPMHDRHHDIADIQKVLDRPDLYDVINVHNLGDPYELEHMHRWLTWEMKQRNYEMPIIVSDTVPTAYIAWGSATRCTGNGLGTVIPPATENDRCALAEFFKRLVGKDVHTLVAARTFVATEHVKRVLIASERHYSMINLSFTFDLPLLTGRLAQAGAGISAWGGAAKFNMRTGRALTRYPLFYAIREITTVLGSAPSVSRVDAGNDAIRLYRLDSARTPTWVAWKEQPSLYIPGESEDVVEARLPVGDGWFTISSVSTSETESTSVQSASERGALLVALTQSPQYIVRRNASSQR